MKIENENSIEGWEFEKLSKITHTFAGGTPKRNNKAYYENGNIPWVKSGEVCQKYITKTEELITDMALENSSTKLIPINSLLVALYGATAGQVGILKIRGCSNQAVLAVNVKNNKTSNHYLYYYLSQYTKLMLRMVQGSGQPNLSKKIVDSLSVALPPLPEQQKIADILSTVDNKIAVIDQQIIATEELKKGLMQRLLTKGIRHTEFKDSPLGKIPKSWEVKRLDRISEIKMGQSPKSSTYNENNIGLPLIQGNADIKNRFSQPRIYTSKANKICDVGDILMTVRAPVGAIALSRHKACIGRGVCAIKASQVNEDFLYQYLLSLENSWKSFEQGSTFTAVNSKDVKNINIPVPPLSEQKEIAETLSKVDAKLQTQKDKKQAYQQLKKGLMQQLLTGKIRVNNLIEA